MVDWYNVRQLAATGIKTVISSIFGNFADKREMQAALNDGGSYDYSLNDELWIDYISDLGDGFNSTYTMAHLLATEQLTVTDNGSKKILKRGDLLIMGGDQVYPTPEKEEYRNRLQIPYNAAFPWNEESKLPHLFVLPGNHDWYDGLANFIKLFCQGRSLGNWHTQQKRSYFALKLPHRVWIWGIDVQLNADIDKPQLDYFDKIASEMQEGDRVILCTAEPAWVFRSINKKDESYGRLKFFECRAITKKFRLVATLTGDLHHYSRYATTNERGEEERQLITAGGGGAFMHPTHFLKDRIQIDEYPAADLKKTFPSKNTSRLWALGNFAFPVLNWQLPFMLALFHILTAWILQSTTKYRFVAGHASSFMEQLSAIECSVDNFYKLLLTLGESLSHNPSVVVLNLILVGGMILFTDTTMGKGKWNYIAGVLHGIIQFFTFYYLIWLFSRINLYYYEMDVDSFKQVGVFSLEMLIVGWLVCGMIFGFYLLLSTLLFQSHPTEAFSSLRATGYKNFLRIHITKNSVTLYPIGVKQVVKNWKNISTKKDELKFNGSPINYELIEPPINLK